MLEPTSTRSGLDDDGASGGTEFGAGPIAEISTGKLRGSLVGGLCEAGGRAARKGRVRKRSVPGAMSLVGHLAL